MGHRLDHLLAEPLAKLHHPLYEQFISTFYQNYGDHEVDDLTPNDILEYLNRITEGLKPNTIRVKFAYPDQLLNVRHRQGDCSCIGDSSEKPLSLSPVTVAIPV